MESSRPAGKAIAVLLLSCAPAIAASHLVGAIWRARAGLAFDVGVRSAHAGGEAIRELRVGLTWTIALKKEP